MRKMPHNIILFKELLSAVYEYINTDKNA